MAGGIRKVETEFARHPTHNVQSAYGWIKKGERKEIPGNSGRSRLNLSGVVDVINHKVLSEGR